MKKKNQITDPTLKELYAIKRLLILGLMKSGATTGEIAKSLGMDGGNFRRAYKTGKVKRYGEK